MSEQNKIVYLNREYLPIEQARVPVLDRGFLFGDGVYEVIPVFGGRLLRGDEHLQRLYRSLQKVGMRSPFDDQGWTTMLQTLLEKNPGEDRYIYLQVTRGVYEVRDLTPRNDVEQTVFAMVMHLVPKDIEVVQAGIRAITVEDFRWTNCDIKSISLIANVMLRQSAVSAGVDDAIMLRDGQVTEGTASNVFLVESGRIITTPTSNLSLPGITRDLVVEIARHHDIGVEIRDIASEELGSADEIWLTSSTREIAPVIELDGRTIGDGVAGEMWHRVIHLYYDLKDEMRRN